MNKEYIRLNENDYVVINEERDKRVDLVNIKDDNNIEEIFSDENELEYLNKKLNKCEDDILELKNWNLNCKYCFSGMFFFLIVSSLYSVIINSWTISKFLSFTFFISVPLKVAEIKYFGTYTDIKNKLSILNQELENLKSNISKLENFLEKRKKN